MSTVLNISLDYGHLMQLAKASHSAFSRGKNGKPYLALSIWVNDEPDEYGNDVKATMNSKKEKKDAEGMIYIGNGQTPEARAKAKAKKQGVETAGEYVDDLPF